MKRIFIAGILILALAGTLNVETPAVPNVNECTGAILAYAWAQNAHRLCLMYSENGGCTSTQAAVDQAAHDVSLACNVEV